MAIDLPRVRGLCFDVDGTIADTDDRIVYNPATGALYFDSDGIGSVDGVLFATLSGAPVIAVGDFLVI